jgi:peroxiredoxin/protocatechuate 3,4-dioxygenase beta subunit
VPFLLAAGLLVVLIGRFGTTRATSAGALDSPGQEAEQGTRSADAGTAPTAPAGAGRLTVRVLSASTGAPLEGVEIFYRGRFDGKSQKGTLTTGPDGQAVITWPGQAAVNALTLEVGKPKYVGQFLDWDDSKHAVSLPAVKELRLESGVPMTGRVQDDAGRPIAGATVTAMAPVTESEQSNFHFGLGTTTTDDQGRWRLDEVPENLSIVSLHVSHPAYRTRAGSSSGGRERLSILTQGPTVKGRVVDPAGNPVKGAKVDVGHDVWGSSREPVTTDERGQYTLRNCEEGPTIVTAQAEGFAPQFQQVRVVARGENNAPEIRLGPAHVLRAKIVDRAGKPVQGAHYAADTWRGHRSIMHRGQTGADGRFTWSSAPEDTVLFDIYRDGYMRRRLYPLTASDAEQVVVLDPELVVSGRVTDGATGAPIPRFRVIQGREQSEGTEGLFWSRDGSVEYTDGRYAIKFDWPMKAWYVRVEAPGYEPAESRGFRSDEGAQVQDFVLKPAEGLSGIVILPDGRPVAGVKVALATREERVTLRGGMLDRDTRAATTITGSDGRFAFPQQDDRFLLVVAADAGFADASPEEFAPTGKLVLQPWGRLEGEVRIGRKPAPHQPVSFQPQRPERGGGLFVWDYGYETETDEHGRFAFSRVVPGPGSVTRNVITAFGGGSLQITPGWHTAVDIVPGASCQVVIGAEGRPVVGHVVLDGTPDEPVDWKHNEPAVLQTPSSRPGEPERLWRQFAANLDADGRFRIDDVVPGTYELRIPVNSPPDPSRCGAGAEIGRATRTVTVPEGPVDSPVDLGDVTVRLLETLKVGDLAPDFTARKLDGGRFKLSEQQGKLVLLDFWATWCSPCLAEMPALRELQNAVNDPRFVLVGMTCDEDPERPAAYVKANGLSWTQAFAGTINGGVAERYHVRAIPATFLIGPDGRILARNLRGPALGEAVRAALKDERLFSTARPASRPPRFPVTRFTAEAGADAQARAGAPALATAALVLDDCDADFQENRPHHDGLRFLAASGQEVQTLKEFHTCESVGASHGVAVDERRGRIYVCELVAHRVTALDAQGRKLWRVDAIDADALAVDPGTGNLWCSVGRNLVHGETVVLDGAGNEVASFPTRAIDLAYDPQTDGFWLVGYGITKLSREGNVLFHKPRQGWACVSVAVDPTDGGVWVAERAHPDVARSANRLWHLDAQGGVLHSIALGEKDPFAVACAPRTGTAWVVSLGAQLLRFARDGKELPPLEIAALSVAASPTSGRIWVTTNTDVLQLDETGAIVSRTPLGSTSGMSRLFAY